jgi:hypothetical protein
VCERPSGLAMESSVMVLFISHTPRSLLGIILCGDAPVIVYVSALLPTDGNSHVPPAVPAGDA